MAKLIWAIPCSRILLDQPSNLVSYIDVLDGVALPSYPALAPLTFIGMVWQREDESKLDVRVRVLSPDGSHVMDSESAQVIFQPHHKRGRIHIGLGGFPIAGPGRFHFAIDTKVRNKWVEQARVPFDLETLPDMLQLEGRLPVDDPEKRKSAIRNGRIDRG